MGDGKWREGRRRKGGGEKEKRVEGGTGREEKIRSEERGDWEKVMATSSKTSRIINIISNQKSEVSQHIHTAQAHRDGSLFSGHALQAAISPWLMAHRAISNWRLWKIMSKCSVILNTGKKKFNFLCQHVIHLQWGWARHQDPGR